MHKKNSWNNSNIIFIQISIKFSAYFEFKENKMEEWIKRNKCASAV